MSDTPVVHAFDDAGRIVQEGISAAATLRDKAIAVLQGLPHNATVEHITGELSAMFQEHLAGEAAATSHGGEPGHVEGAAATGTENAGGEKQPAPPPPNPAP